MAFDNTQPTDTTKIRNLGTVIRPNFVAIEQADSSFEPYAINLIDRTAAAIVPTNPASIATSYSLYSRQDSSATELFGIGPAGTAIQLTRGVPSHGTSGHTFLPGTQASGGMLLAWNREAVASAGTITVSAFSSTIYSVTITINDSSATPSERAYVYNVSGTSFKVRTNSGNAVTIYWQAIGI